jgi:predicted nucleic acid-binding protein
VIAAAAEQPLTLPEEISVSAMTLAELHVGVLVTDDPDVRAARLKTLTSVEHEVEVLPIDDRVARSFGEIVATARRSGHKPAVADALIAATAQAHSLTLYTCDADFEGFEGLAVVRADKEGVMEEDPSPEDEASA